MFRYIDEGLRQSYPLVVGRLRSQVPHHKSSQEEYIYVSLRTGTVLDGTNEALQHIIHSTYYNRFGSVYMKNNNNNVEVTTLLYFICHIMFKAIYII